MVCGRLIEWGDRMCLMIACCAMGAGCVSPAHTADSAANGPTDVGASTYPDDVTPPPFGSESSDDDTVVLQMMFEVQRVLIPSDTPAEDREILWKYVDELRIDPELSEHLGRNGLRVGIANRAGLAALRALFQRLGAIDERTLQPVRSGYPLTLELGTIDESTPVFTFDREGHLSGTSFSHAVEYLHVDYDCTEPPKTTLRITPEIFKESEQPDWQTEDGEIKYKKRYVGRVFEDLVVELQHGPDELLVVGPSVTPASRLVVGSALLVHEFAGRSWDAVYCIAPLLYRAGDERSWQ